ncbi:MULTISPECIES: ABC transporter permease [Ureibacillus]|jgi:peptide/nickel transport system permease protein|uniref:Peptide/nickel transport system permease protein n=1 Tax=Ureibacillus thermosphaericus TaxID=51173 RepID=A0A840PWL2_URETH|nr:ABC transporter permease [Ureibacillus thermosphaericus]MBB5150260.1 peptide/nickel transport system permease protein [Ureibacillus thermosphaericus]NKZ32833.1 ABC transporter permease [Ureibacillus thermosphaericus]
MRRKKKRYRKNGRPRGIGVAFREFQKDKIALVSLFLLVLFILFVFIASFFIDQEQLMRINLYDRYSRPGEKYLLGADQGGKDILGQLIIGARNSVSIALAITLITGFIGIVVGLICGYFGGWVDYIIMRIIDFFVTIPSLLFIIVFVTLVPKYSITSFILIMSLFLWTGTARLVRSKALSESKRDYVSASKTLGTSDFVILRREVAPNLSSLLIVELTLNFAGNVGIETGLSYLGFGLPPTTPSLGTLVSYANNPAVLQQYWWVWLPASLLILFMMLAINYIGQALRRSVDVKQRLG